MSLALLKIAARARHQAAATRGPAKAQWMTLGRLALTAYRRWRKLSDDERREFEEGPLKPHVDRVATSAQELYTAARRDRDAVGTALVRLLKSLQRLLDVMVVRFGSDPGDGGAPAFA